MHDDTRSGTALAPASAPSLGSDPHDFAGLYIRHRASFTSHARRYLRDPRDADEVVQEAFLRLFLAMPELESELQALAYCRRTITNLCIDRYRADARRPRLVALDGAPVEDLAEDDRGDPVVRAEDAALVRQALSQLPELHRRALVKREIEEKSLPVIADELDVAEDSVKHLLFRARRTLRKLLAGTSAAPGIDPELTRGLRPAARGASGGLAALVLLALIGLGSGPDLRSVPVVGVDLPDVLGVTAVADAVGGAVREVVGALVPGERAEASAAGRDRAEPVSRSQAGTPGGPQAGAADSAQAPAGAAAQDPTSTGLAPGASGGRTTTVVSVVDGVPVVSVVPAPPGLLPAEPGTRTTAPGTTTPGTTTSGTTTPGNATGRGAGPALPPPVGPQVPTVGRAVPAGSPVGAVLPPAATPARPSVPDTSGRTDGAVPAGDRAGERAADAAEKAAKGAEKAADRAADTAAKADKAAEQAAERAEKAAEQAAMKAAKDAEKAAKDSEKAAEKAAKDSEKAAKDAEKAAKDAEKASEKSAKDAQKAAEKAAKAAADRAADRAAAQQ